MQKAYSRILWENYPSTETPINEINLNKIDSGLNTVDDRVVAMDVTKANQTDMLQAVKSIAYDDSTGTFTITFFNNTTATINTDLEKLAINFDYDDDPTSPYYQHIIIELDDGTVKYIDLSSLITEFEFDDTDTIAISVSNTGVVSADVIDGSITGQKLQPNYLADITVQANNASASATRANDSELESEAWAVGTRNGQPVPNSHPAYHNNAYWWSQKANVTSLVSLTDVEIDLDTLADGQLFGYDGTLEKWTNVNAPATGAVPHVIVLSEAGSTVRLEKGTTTIYATETSAEHFECDLEMQNPKDIYGVWTIHAVLDGDDAMISLNVDTIKVYVVDDSHMHADITVTYPGGATVSCSKTGEQTMYATSSPYTFTVHSTGVWTITGTRNGVTETQTVTITTNGQTESITLTIVPDGSTVTPTDDVQTLLQCADIWDKTTYTTISDLLADDISLLTVLTSDNAIDYLVRSTTFASAITADEDAMAMIGSYDYASDTLLADSTWKTAIDGSTYRDSVYNAKVPAMTSNTTPSGVASASSYYDASSMAYKAFDGTDARWTSSISASAPHWVQYEFTRAIKAVLFGYNCYSNNRTGTFKVQASNDGSSWTDLTDTTTAVRDSQNHYLALNNSTEYTKYRMYVISQTDYGVTQSFVQFYGRENGGVQTWLRSANITDKDYTTLAEVLADTTTLATLIASQSAVDYLVTAKAFIDGIVADATAMSYIGLNNYCANTLLADAEWKTAMFDSAYREAVYNVKAPIMTSNNTPSGVCSASSEGGGQEAYKAFDGTTNFWNSTQSNAPVWVGYTFPNNTKVFFAEIQFTAYASSSTVKIQGGSGNTDVSDSVTISGTTKTKIPITNPSDDYAFYRAYISAQSKSSSYAGVCQMLQFYGREDV